MGLEEYSVVSNFYYLTFLPTSSVSLDPFPQYVYRTVEKLLHCGDLAVKVTVIERCRGGSMK